jgi:hypothetical protein
MKAWQITIEHTATGRRYTLPVLAQTKAEALTKARGWPYTTDAYTVVNQGESK